MNFMPPIPSWEGFHPLVVHFPIVLLLVAPLLVLIGILSPRGVRGFFAAALVVMALGTASAFLSFATGEASEERAEKVARAEAVLERHEDLAKTTRIVFPVLTLLFAGMLFHPLVRRRPQAAAARVLGFVFLVVYAGGAVVLVNTAHQGARLVHEFGIHAPVAGAEPTAAGVEAGDAGAGAEEHEGGRDHD